MKSKFLSSLAFEPKPAYFKPYSRVDFLGEVREYQQPVILNMGRDRHIFIKAEKHSLVTQITQLRLMVRTAYGSELLQIAALVNRKFSTCMGISQHILGRNARVF